LDKAPVVPIAKKVPELGSWPGRSSFVIRTLDGEVGAAAGFSAAADKDVDSRAKEPARVRTAKREKLENNLIGTLGNSGRGRLTRRGA
jgi:hypothetical protein